jgi:long-chain fatty acid transport protein
MKKMFFLFLTALLLSAGTLFAGNLDYLSNQSALYLQTLNRNAATDGADIVNYNPAGTAFMPQGLHLDLSNQTLFKYYRHSADSRLLGLLGFLPNSAGSDSLSPERITWLLPNFYLSYNFGNMGPGRLAVNFQAGVTAGGGDLDYGDGTAGSIFALNILRASLMGSGMNIGWVNSRNFTASSIYYGVGLGGAYSFFDDTMALSFGVRMVIPRRSFTMEGLFTDGINFTTVKAAYEYNALGFTPIFGFDIRPLEKITIGLRWELETDLIFKYRQKEFLVNSSNTFYQMGATRGIGTILTGNGITDGKEFNSNLPHILGVGVEYEVLPGLALDTSGTLYFLPYADLSRAEHYFTIGYDIGLGASWQIVKEIKLGAGFSFTESGAKAEYFSDSSNVLNGSANPPLDSIAFGLGGTYSFPFGLDLNLGFLFCHYLPVEYAAVYPGATAVNGTNKKNVFEVGIGVSFHY